MSAANPWESDPIVENSSSWESDPIISSASGKAPEEKPKGLLDRIADAMPTSESVSKAVDAMGSSFLPTPASEKDGAPKEESNPSEINALDIAGVAANPIRGTLNLLSKAAEQSGNTDLAQSYRNAPAAFMKGGADVLAGAAETGSLLLATGAKYNPMKATVDLFAKAADAAGQKDVADGLRNNGDQAQQFVWDHITKPIEEGREPLKLDANAMLPEKLANSLGSAAGLLAAITLSGIGVAGESASATQLSELTATKILGTAADKAASTAIVPLVTQGTDRMKAVYDKTGGDIAATMKAGVGEYLGSLISFMVPAAVEGGPIARMLSTGVGMTAVNEGLKPFLNLFVPKGMESATPADLFGDDAAKAKEERESLIIGAITNALFGIPRHGTTHAEDAARNSEARSTYVGPDPRALSDSEAGYLGKQIADYHADLKARGTPQPDLAAETGSASASALSDIEQSHLNYLNTIESESPGDYSSAISAFFPKTVGGSVERSISESIMSARSLDDALMQAQSRLDMDTVTDTVNTAVTDAMRMRDTRDQAAAREAETAAQVQADFARAEQQAEQLRKQQEDTAYRQQNIQRGEEQASLANVLTRTSGFDSKEPTAMELAMRRAQETKPKADELKRSAARDENPEDFGISAEAPAQTAKTVKGRPVGDYSRDELHAIAEDANEHADARQAARAAWAEHPDALPAEPVDIKPVPAIKERLATPDELRSVKTHEPGKIGNDMQRMQHKALTPYMRLLGREVRIVDPKDLPAGVKLGGDGYTFGDGKLYISKDATVDPKQVAFHEFGHTIEKKLADKPGGAELRQALRESLDDEMKARFIFDRTGEKFEAADEARRRAAAAEFDKDAKRNASEYEQDHWGRGLAKESVWAKAFESITEKYGDKQAVQIIARLVNSIREHFRTYRAAFAGERGFNYTQMAKNLDAIEAAMSKALGEHLRDQKVDPKTLEIERLEAQRKDAKGEKVVFSAKKPEDVNQSDKDVNQSPTRILFEVAPDPHDKALSARWNVLSDEKKTRISQAVARDVMPDVFEAAGIKAHLEDQFGGYLDDTNPSFAAVVERGSARDLIAATKMAGFALSQDSMMTVSRKSFEGSFETGLVTVTFPGVPKIGEVREVYAKLRKLDPELIQGHTTVGREMMLAVESGRQLDLAYRVKDALGESFEVDESEGRLAFPERKDYDYDHAREGSELFAGREAAHRIRSKASSIFGRELDRVEGKPSRDAGDAPSFSAQRAAEEIKRYADEYGDTFFRTRKTDAKGVEDIARDVDPSLHPEAIDPESFAADPHSLDFTTNRALPDQAWRFRFEGESDGKQFQRDAYLMRKNNAVWVNVGNLSPGDNGGHIYMVAGAYAHNNGLKLIGDPDGITTAGKRRRLENMIALALKYGTTKFMEPHKDMLGWQGLRWFPNAENLPFLLQTSHNLVERLYPEIDDVRFDFDTGKFMGSIPAGEAGRGAPRGERALSRDDFTRMAERLRKGLGADAEGAPGGGTLRQAALFGSLVSGKNDPSRGDSLLLRGRDDVGKESLRRSLEELKYSDERPAPAPVFFSQLSRSIEGRKQDTSTGNDWSLWLQSNAGKLGIKKDEIQWTGITDWLQTQGKAKVSKADIAEYLKQGGVQVKEVVLRDDSAAEGDNRLYEWAKSQENGADDPLVGAIISGESYDAIRRRATASGTSEVLDILDGLQEKTKFSQYVLPGGESYRELLLTLPVKQTLPDGFDVRQMANGKWGVFGPGPLPENRYGSGATREAAIASFSGHGHNGPVFTSSHFDQPNILAHVRFDDRTDAEGRKVLFLEEVQSDWQQAKRSGKDVPDGPLISDTKATAALALKRMIRYAADNGYDAISWTHGDQQAERYDLSKQIKEVRYRDGDLTAWDKSGNRIVDEAVSENRIEDFIGKDAAQKLLSPEHYDPDSEAQVLSGLDLKVGGEGMRGYYDQILPQVARDVMKKLGGGEVGALDLGNHRQNAFTGELDRDIFDVEHEGQPGIILSDAMKAKAQEGMPLFSARRSVSEARVNPQLASWADRIQQKYRTDEAFVVLRTPSVALQRGGVFRPVGIDAPHVRHIFNTHPEITPQDIGRLPEWLTSPRAIIQRGAGEWRVLVDGRDGDGNPISVALTNVKGDGIKVTGVSTIFGTEGSGRYLARQLLDGNVRYVRDSEVARVRGLIGDATQPFEDSWPGPQLPIPQGEERLSPARLTSEREITVRSDNGPVKFRASKEAIDQLSDDIAFSASRTPEQAEAMSKGGLIPKRQTLKDRVMPIVDRMKDADWNRQEFLDQFHGIKVAEGDQSPEHSAYVAARLSTGLSSVMRGVLMHGAPRWMNDVRLEKTPGSKGLLDILRPVSEDLDGWLGWMVGKRAERLMQQGKENNFTADDIKALVSLAGPAGGKKEQQYRAVSREFAGFKRAILDVAEQAGVIDGATRPMWDQLDWIPFYRVMDNGDAKGSRPRRGLAGQSSGIRTLKGGSSAINDPLENIVMSFTKLIDASLKNNAVRLALKNAPDMFDKVPMAMSQEIIPMSQVKKQLIDSGIDPGLVAQIPSAQLQGIAKMWAIKPPTDPDVIKIMDDGKAGYYKVSDPLLLNAVTAWEPLGDSVLLDAGRWFKSTLTYTVTAMPDFMVRNFIRDSVSAGILAPHGHNVVDAMRGAVRSIKESGGFEDMLFAGASFAGGNVESGNPKSTARQIRRSLRDVGFRATVLDTPAKLWTAYARLGEAAENANREAIYEQTLAKTGDRTMAAYEAKDIMDFSMQGRNKVYRTMTAVIPFMNARVQGVHRIFRSTDRARLLMGGLALTMGSLALWYLNKDDEDYKALEDWDKNTYWHFKIPGGSDFYRIPKPFELGAIFGTLPERFADTLYGNQSTKKAVTQMAAVVLDQFNFTGGMPIPQIVKPLFEVQTNKDSFSGRQIESEGDKQKLPHLRYNEHTSDAMRSLTELAAPVTDPMGLSPKVAQHLVKGYFGTLGSYVLGLADLAVRNIEGRPALPKKRLDQIPIVKAFVEQNPAQGTVYQTDLYEMWREVSEIDKSVKQLQKEGQIEDAKALIDANIEKLKQKGGLEAATKTLSQIRKRVDQIYRDENMDPGQKRQAIDRLMERQNMISKIAAKRAQPAF